MYQHPQQSPQWQRQLQPNTQYPPQWQPRPPYPQQPYQPPPPYYPQQQYYQPMPPPMMPLPPQKSREWPWVLLAITIVLCVVCGLLGSVAKSQDSTASTTTSDVQSADTPVPTQGTWTVIHTYNGNGVKKTEIFTVGNDWKIDYACTGFSDGTGVGGDLSVAVYGADNSYIDMPVNEQCPAGKNTTGESEEHQGGSVYLGISADGGGWVVQVQELQ